MPRRKSSTGEEKPRGTRGKKTPPVAADARQETPSGFVEVSVGDPGEETGAHLTQKQAWDAVATELKAGRMARPGACMTCDAKEKVWGHHWRGYDHPLDVWWVCSSCNRLLEIHDGSQSLEQARVDVAAKRTAMLSGERVESERERKAAASRKRSDARREIGPLPKVADPERKAASRESLLFTLRTYFPRRFKLAFAECHLTAIAEMERAVREGELLTCAMPRGSGKTAIAECAVLWALLHGYQRFAVLLQATQKLAAKSFKKIKKELETNDLLAADFPEVCYPIRKLDRSSNRARRQTLDGVPTEIEWTAESVTLPTVADSIASGATMMVVGIESASRGLSVLGPGGDYIRPGLVLVDDAQTRDTAKSPPQTDDREAIIADDVMGMVGPGESMALINLCTPIYPNDLAERFLSAEKHPEFRHVRTKMVEAFPERMDLWEEYAEIRRESLRSGDEGKRATEFYREHREEMDKGARLSWPDRKKKKDLSGLQTAMNWFFTNPRGFRTEGQCETEPPGGATGRKELLPANVSGRLSGLPRLQVPREATRLTAMIDPGGGDTRGIWFAVAAWDPRFGGSCIDYGVWPEQNRSLFAADDLRPGLTRHYDKLSLTQAVYQGLVDVSNAILGRVYYREATGEELRVERCLIDCGWETATVYQFCRASPHRGIVYPSKGIGRTQTARGVSEWKPRPGEQSGYHWRLTMSETGRGRMVQFDPDAWKTLMYERLTTAPGGAGSFTLYGKSSGTHEMIGLHCAAEYAEPKELRGSVFDKWEKQPGDPDNHLLDCLVGCALAAGVQGLKWESSPNPGAGGPPAPAVKKLPLSQRMELKRQEKERKDSPYGHLLGE